MSLVGLLVGAIAEIGPTSGPYRVTVDLGYAQLMAPIADQTNATAKALANLLGPPIPTNRVAFFSGLDSVASRAAQTNSSADSLEAPGPAAAPARLCDAALANRASATGKIRFALESLLGGRTGSGSGSEAAAAASMEQAGSSLMESDVEWARCRSGLGAAPGHAQLAESTWVTDVAAWSTDAMGSFVAQVAGSTGLAAQPALAVTVLAPDPVPITTSAGVEVIPPVTSLGLHAVIANTGNVDENAVVVSATVAGTQSSRSATVDVAAGRSVAVDLSGLAISPGTSVSVQVKVESANASTSASLALQVAQAAPTSTAAAVRTKKPPLREGPVEALWFGSRLKWKFA